MSNAHDRRAPGTSRMPFEAMVEVGGALGPTFEAQALNLSEEGMSLRTAYLPAVGQPVMCRFDAGNGSAVTAAGEVLWNEDMGDGGEFGIRFTNLDGASTVALQGVLGMAEDGHIAPLAPGRKVRLHIEGLASPMRARIKDQMKGGVIAYTDLGFLRMDRALSLEDAESGGRRPAMIERVEVEVDGHSKVPQLIVGLRYDDEEGRRASSRASSMSSLAAMEVPVDATPHDEHMPTHEDDVVHSSDALHAEAAPSSSGDVPVDEDEEGAPNKIKAAFAKGAAKVGPAIKGWAMRAKVAAALIAAKARRGKDTGEDVEIPIARRTTAPAPSGGLTSDGRKVVRSSLGSIHEERFEDSDDAKPKLKITKKKAAAIAVTVGLATILLFFAMKKPNAQPALASAPPDPAAALATPITTAATPAPAPAPVPPPDDPLAAQAANMNASGTKHGKAVPFTNGSVGAHPNIIKIKMDGPIGAIEGATQPAGFTIVTPGRKGTDPGAALADKDLRLAGLNISNEPTGAELTVTFKDGVPNYLVRAKGDTLELVLAGASTHAEKSTAHETHESTKKHSAHKKH